MEQSNSWLTSVPDSRNQWDVSNMLTLSCSVSLYRSFAFAISLSLLSFSPCLPPATPLFIWSHRSSFGLSIPFCHSAHPTNEFILCYSSILLYFFPKNHLKKHEHILSFLRDTDSLLKLTNTAVVHTNTHTSHFTPGAWSAAVI